MGSQEWSGVGWAVTVFLLFLLETSRYYIHSCETKHTSFLSMAFWGLHSLQLCAGVLLASAADILPFLRGSPNFVQHPILPTSLSYGFISSVASSCYFFREGRGGCILDAVSI
jgi:hypothetical protein